MASVIYTPFKAKSVDGTLDLDTDDFRVLPVGGSTTADTEEDAEFLDDFTTLDELDATNQRKTLAGEAVATDTANDRAEWTHNAVTWTAANFGTIAGFVYYEEGSGTDATRAVVAFIDTADLVTNGGDVTLTPDAEGVLQLT